MQVSSNGRVRRSEAEWRQIMVRFAESGLSRRAFCLREKLHPAGFDRWYRRLAEPPRDGFVEVRPSGRAALSSWAVEVELACGTIVRVGS